MSLFIYFVTLGIDWYSIRISLQLIDNKILAKRHMVEYSWSLNGFPHCQKRYNFIQDATSAPGKINPSTVVKALLKFSWVQKQSDFCTFPDFWATVMYFKDRWETHFCLTCGMWHFMPDSYLPGLLSISSWLCPQIQRDLGSKAKEWAQHECRWQAPGHLFHHLCPGASSAQRELQRLTRRNICLF